MEQDIHLNDTTLGMIKGRIGYVTLPGGAEWLNNGPSDITSESQIEEAILIEAERFSEDAKLGHKVIISSPKESSRYSPNELESMGVFGIYEVPK